MRGQHDDHNTTSTLNDEFFCIIYCPLKNNSHHLKPLSLSLKDKVSQNLLHIQPLGNLSSLELIVLIHKIERYLYI